MKFPFAILSQKKHLPLSPSSELIDLKRAFDESQEKIIQQENQIKDLNVQIGNFIIGAQDLQQELTCQKQIIASLKLKNNGLDEMLKEATVRASTTDIQSKEASSQNDDLGSSRQISNLKTKISELEKEIEAQKQITNSKNKEINQLRGL